MKKILWLTLLLFAFALPQAFAEETASDLSIRLQLDHDTVTINGETSVIEAPYLSEGSTLVPLRVITTAFGAALQWDGKTQTIVLESGDKTIKLVIDKLEAEVNGSKEMLPAAPALKNDTTMVPIRFISETFGAHVGFDPATYVITITGKRSENPGNSAGIDSDAGKTKIGNSYYGWSMKYPSGLAIDYQTFREDWVSLSHVDGDYSLHVSVETDKDAISKENLMKLLVSDAVGTVLDKRYVDNVPTPYVKVVSKEDGAIYEVRAYQKDRKLYNVSLAVDKEKNYTDAAKGAGIKEVIDSFTVGFNASDDTVKDLSTVKDGQRHYRNEDIGFAVKLPAQWSMDNSGDWMHFGSDDEHSSLAVRVTSLKESDTAEAWAARDRKDFEDTFVADYRKSSALENAKVSGLPATKWIYGIKNEQDKWTATYGYYVVKGEFKYEIDVMFDAGYDDAKLADSIIQSVELTGLNEDMIGYLEDDRDFIDRSKKTESTFKKMNLAVTVPDYWTIDPNTGDTEFLYHAGRDTFTVMVTEEVTLDQAKKNWESRMAEQLRGQTAVRSGPVTFETIGGVPATVYHYLGAETVNVYIFEKNGKVYLMITTISKATATEANVKRFDDVVKSIKFVE